MEEKTCIVYCHNCGSRYLITLLEPGYIPGSNIINYCHYCGKNTLEEKDYLQWKEGRIK
jgi:hypothetical protein